MTALFRPVGVEDSVVWRCFCLFVSESGEIRWWGQNRCQDSPPRLVHLGHPFSRSLQSQLPCLFVRLSDIIGKSLGVCKLFELWMDHAEENYETVPWAQETASVRRIFLLCLAWRINAVYQLLCHLRTCNSVLSSVHPHPGCISDLRSICMESTRAEHQSPRWINGKVESLLSF